MFSLGALKSLKPYVWPYKNWLFFSLFMAIPLSALRAAPVPILKRFIDEVLVQKDPSKLLIFWICLVFELDVVDCFEALCKRKQESCHQDDAITQ